MMICGTRGSQLAQVQTQLVLHRLERLFPHIGVVRRVVRTSGDVFKQSPLTEFGGTGAFVKEIDNLLRKGDIDFAVHSLKDVPTRLREGIEIAAVLPRGNPRDYLISDFPLGRLPAGTKVGTSSLRRKAQLLRLRPDLTVVPLRGNVPTRVRKVEDGGLDAAIVARAGLDRLGLSPPGYTLRIKDFVPSPSQGAIAVVARKGSESSAMIGRLNHGPTRLATEVERLAMALLRAGCTAPVGIYATCIGDRIRIRGMVLSTDGRESVEHEATFPHGKAHDGVKRFVEELRSLGGEALVKEAGEAARAW